jgi:hypothetical protein
MPKITVNIDVCCAVCGEDLSSHFGHINGRLPDEDVVIVDPCKTCIAQLREEFEEALP